MEKVRVKIVGRASGLGTVRLWVMVLGGGYSSWHWRAYPHGASRPAAGGRTALFRPGDADATHGKSV
jgi:hypothetical protein